MKVKQLFRSRKPSAERLYAAIVASARQPALYGIDGAPDTLEGRLTVITLNLALAIRRLGELGEREAAQQLIESFFQDVEGNLRESGVSDVAIPKRMRAIEAIYVSTMKKLETGLAADEPQLCAAIATGFADLPDTGTLLAVSAHAVRTRDRLASLAADHVLNGEGWV